MAIELAILLASLRSEIDRAWLESARKYVPGASSGGGGELGQGGRGGVVLGAVAGWPGAINSAETHVIKLRLATVTDTGEAVDTADGVLGLMSAG
ncbi:MAG TPA: hypothetical protein VGS97_18275 [Actinocrinis sp.]|uniref:hypothetical protein n=1 Tax=Actinocrinis sp. TaxID=1920516 RepID=UPI002DDCB1A9|nr:hypothetical protein [Actinocrinis sp.]HEV2346052.1 hypothetical protein [Actinocrinis sp.]